MSTIDVNINLNDNSKKTSSPTGGNASPSSTVIKPEVEIKASVINQAAIAAAKYMAPILQAAIEKATGGAAPAVTDIELVMSNKATSLFEKAFKQNQQVDTSKIIKDSVSSAVKDLTKGIGMSPSTRGQITKQTNASIDTTSLEKEMASLRNEVKDLVKEVKASKTTSKKQKESTDTTKWEQKIDQNTKALEESNKTNTELIRTIKKAAVSDKSDTPSKNAPKQEYDKFYSQSESDYRHGKTTKTKPSKESIGVEDIKQNVTPIIDKKGVQEQIQDAAKGVKIPVTIDTSGIKEKIQDIGEKFTIPISTAGINTLTTEITRALDNLSRKASSVNVQLDNVLEPIRSIIENPKEKALDLTALEKKLNEVITHISGLNIQGGSENLSGVLNELQSFIRRSGRREVDKQGRSFANASSTGALRPGDLSGMFLNYGMQKSTRKLIQPLHKDAAVEPVGLDPMISKGAQEIRKLSDVSTRGLSKSLHTLQTNIIESLEKNFENGSWKVMRPEGQDVTQAFKPSEGDRKWVAEIADVGAIRTKLLSLGKTSEGLPSGAEPLVKMLRDELAKSEVDKIRNNNEGLAGKIGQWLVRTPEDKIRKDPAIDAYKQILLRLKQSDVGKGTMAGPALVNELTKSFDLDKLQNIFKETEAKANAESVLYSKYIKRLGIPAARIEPDTRTTTIGTVHGSERSVPKYVKFETGFERLFDKLVQERRDPGIRDIAIGLSADIAKIGIRPTGSKLKEADILSKKLLREAFGNKPTDDIKQQAIYAAKIKDYETQKAGVKSTLAQDVEQSFSKQLPTTMDDLTDRLEKLGLSVYDVVKSMDRLEELDMYSMLNKILVGKPGKSPLGSMGFQPSQGKSIRDFEEAITEFQGTMPLADTDRARRGFHQESVVNLLTKTSPIFQDQKRLNPSESKDLIKDLNLRFDEFIDAKRNVPGGEPLPHGITRLSTLGLVEEGAQRIREYRSKGGSGEEKLKHLKNLDATALEFYSQDLTDLAPFSQFQQIGRNISNVTNAMSVAVNKDVAKRHGIPIPETPSLRSSGERDVIESGKYGKTGYGYNVVAELRNTASNFEDQIVISGKLAKALTSVVKTLVKPSAGGRISSGGAGPSASTVTDITEKEIKHALEEYMRVLGKPVKYEGRSDQAIISEVKKVIATVRGEPVEVQQAKLAETFLNYFGRKFTTRYGSKGVSVATRKNADVNIADIMSEYAGTPVKIDPSQNLGAAMSPKSMGRLATELFGKDLADSLHKELIESGNKFIIDLFHQTGEGAVVIANEANKSAEIYKELSEAWSKKFDESLNLGEPGIQQIKEKYKEKFSEKGLMEVKPIDVRISSYGTAKRGLQTEFLESIMSNVAGTGEGGKTTMPTLSQDTYTKLLGKTPTGTSDAQMEESMGMLSKLSKALGYESASSAQLESIAKELYSGKEAFESIKEKRLKITSGEAVDASTKKDVDEYDKSMRAAILESSSNYYSTVVDEVGKKRKGVVGTKFMQIIEEPHLFPEWSKENITMGEKGARIDQPAFSAYATVFGEKSAMLKEIQSSMDTSSDVQWEYLKALQAINTQNIETYNALTQGLRKIDISEKGLEGKPTIKEFDLSTGSYIDPTRDFKDTILDTNKFMSAFMLQLPTGKLTPEGTPAKEDFYVPGPLARGTYADALVAGEEGMESIGRRLVHIVNMAKSLSAFMESPIEIDNKKLAKSIEDKITGLTVEAYGIRSKPTTSESVPRLEEIYNTLLSLLSETKPPLDKPESVGSERSYITNPDPTKGIKAQYFARKGKPETVNYADTIGKMRDVLIGNVKGEKKEYSGLAMAKSFGTPGLLPFSEKLGINTQALKDEALNYRIAALQKAKVDYYYSLAETVKGKKGSIDTVMFGRKIPSVIGKAVTAVVDKRSDLNEFNNVLNNIVSEYSGRKLDIVEDIKKDVTNLLNVKDTHVKQIADLKKTGTPTLKSGTVGIPESLAKKIPATFKKAAIDKETGEFTVGEEEEGSIYGMLKMISTLKKSTAYRKDENIRTKIDEYIDKEVVPFVESIRFPFTGESSLVPYKPKLIKDDEYGGLAKNALVVPGIPEGLDDLGKVIGSVQDKIKKLSERREGLYETGLTDSGAVEEAGVLTDIIRKLSAAISDVIPKYAAQAQKLDFDGDQIELHSAKTVGARKNLQEHYKKFYRRDPDKDPDIGDVYRTKFLSDAVVKSTGKYVIGEASKTFEKKFESGKGFDFMKSPFLTKDLEYLSGKQALSAMSTGGGNVRNILGDVISDLPAHKVSGERKEGLIARLDTIKPEEGKDKEYVDALMNIIQGAKTEIESIDVLVEKGIKQKLYESKLSDAVEAQLYKLHTGVETEGMYRINRAAEAGAGFGAEGGKPSEYFEQRYPSDLKSLGENAAKEFGTMMNEVLRFAIQKGMDVKHAGEKPLAGEITRFLTKGETAELWTKVQKDKSYDDLKKFSDSVEETIKGRLGALPTIDVEGIEGSVYSEAEKIVSSRGESTDLSGKSRQQLIDLIVEKVGFKGFIEELSALIENEAVAGLVEQGYGVGKAQSRVDWQKSMSGISLRTTAQTGSQPMSLYRSSMMTEEGALGTFSKENAFKIQNRQGAPAALGAIKDKSTLRSYQFKFDEAAATAEALKQDFGKILQSTQSGSYTEMTKGAIENLNNRQKLLEDALKKVDLTTHQASKNMSIADRVLSGEGLTNLSTDILKSADPEDEIKKLSELSATPYAKGIDYESIIQEQTIKIADEMRADIKKRLGESATTDDIQTELETVMGDLSAKVKNIYQLDRIIDNLSTTNLSEKGILGSFFGGYAGAPTTSGASKPKPSAASIVKDSLREKTGFAGTMPNTGDGGEGGGVGIGAGGRIGGGGPGEVVNVYLVGVASGVFGNLKELANISGVGVAGTRFEFPSNPEADELKSLISKMKGKIQSETPISYENTISPSTLKGGGEYPYRKDRFRSQIDALKKRLTTSAEEEKNPEVEAAAAIGEIVNTKIRQLLKDNTKFKTEVFGTKAVTGGTLEGTADIVEYGSEGSPIKIADVKTIKSDKLEVIKELAVKHGGDLQKIINDAGIEDSIKHKLENYYSQLNAYLSIFGADKGELKFYSSDIADIKDLKVDKSVNLVMKQDVERFNQDIEAVNTAREELRQQGIELASSTQVRRSETVSDISDEELNRALAIAKKQRGIRPLSRVVNNKGDLGGFSEFAEAFANKKAGWGTVGGFDKVLESLNFGQAMPATGPEIEALYKNLRTLHEQAKSAQQEKGVDVEAFKTMPKQVQGMLKTIQTEGTDDAKAKEFFDMTTALRDLKTPDFGPLAFIKAWKMYRMAVGDYMLERMKEAKEAQDQFSAEGKPYEALDQLKILKTYAGRFQKTITKGLGKKTDIYTLGNRFYLPEIAQAAGVYKTTEQLLQSSSEPIGEDIKTRALYEKSVLDINKNVKPTAPVDRARGMFRDMTNMDSELASVLSTAEKFERLGPEVIDAWDLEKLAERATKLRAAFANLIKDPSSDMDVVQRKNIENTVKYLKGIEALYSGKDFSKEKTGYGQIGITPVPKFETPEMQKAMHARNIQATRKYFTKTEEGGGPPIDERFTYQEKIIGESGETIKSTMHHFKKYGEEVNSAGEKVGMFSEKQQDLIAKMQNTNSSLSNAVKRVIMWGAASKSIYGGVAYLKNSLDEITKIESGMAEVRMVMNPLTTDFSKMAKSAVAFGKQYGVPVTSLIGSMKVFAQQGLTQEEVLDRTKTSTLASNVTTLSAKDATEALTAAMKVFREEGSSSMRMLDAWSEVEAKHAITADDMANAIKKSALAAKTAGVDFDQLNGIVAAIGSTTRQTGSEVGTSLRFMFQRLSTEKGPKALARLNIPVITESGEIRKGFDVLGDLAGKWNDLTNAQKMNVAQSIGGTRQYNSVLVLMDQWDEVLRGVANSVNSKGSAERRNEEVMKTYAKQLEQTRVAATELKMEFGKIILPVFKGGLSALRGMFTTLTEVPSSVKMLGAGMALFITYAAKGLGLVEGITGSLDRVKGVFGNLFGEFGKQMKLAKFEVFGKKTRGVDVFGLKTLTKDSAGEMVEQGRSLGDFHSSLGQLLFMIKSVGESYNEFLGNALVGTGKVTEQVGELAKSIGNTMMTFGTGGALNVVDDLQKAAATGGLSGEEVGATMKNLGVRGLGLLSGKYLRFASAMAGVATNVTGSLVDKSGEFLGSSGQKLLKDFVGSNSDFVKAVAPITVTTVALLPAIKSMYEYWGKITKSAQDYESSVNAVKSKQVDELKTIKDTGSSYDALSKKLENIRELSKPEVKAKRQSLENYVSPLTEMQNVQKDVIDLSNQLANSNVNLAAGYDKLGNAILKTTGDFKTYIGELERLKTKELIKTDIDVLDKYIADLTSTEGPEKWKKVVKDLVESAPLVGDVIGKSIKMSPASVLDEATTRLNKLVGLKNKNPLATAADADIAELQNKLKEARDLYQENFKDFRNVQGNILSAANIKSLSRSDITKLLSSDTMRKAYELQIQVDPKFKLVKGVKPEDIMGKDILSALNPSMSGLLGATSKSTTANFESAGIKASKGVIKPGDLVTFLAGKKATRDMAGQQAVVKYKKTADDVYEWVVEYFNTKTLKIEERPFSKSLERVVDNIFPIHQIKDDLGDRMEALNTFVTGAAAGLVGIDAKKFKLDFNLGERFFGEIPTTNLIQTSKGYSPTTGFGQVEAKKDWPNQIQKFFFEPMEQLTNITEDFAKLKLEGIEEPNISKQVYDEFTKLNDVLKNNQIVLQFRALYSDLEKTFAEGDRVLKEGLAVNQTRRALDVETSGLLAGTSRNLSNIVDINTFKPDQLTAQQRLGTSDSFKSIAGIIQDLDTVNESLLNKMDSVVRAISNLDVIEYTAKGFGAEVAPDKMSEFIEKVAGPGNLDGVEKLIDVNKKVDTNTADTVDRLDEMLANMGDPEATERVLEKIASLDIDKISKMSTGSIPNVLESLARRREKFEKTGNQDGVNVLNKAIDSLSSTLVERLGFEDAVDTIDDNFTFLSKRFKAQEMAQRAFSPMDTKTVMSKFSEYADKSTGGFLGMFKTPPIEESEELQKFMKLQKDDGKRSIVSAKNLAKVSAVMAVLTTLQKSGNNEIVKNLDTQINVMDAQIAERGKAGPVPENEMRDMYIKKEGLVAERESLQKDIDFYTSVQAMSQLSFVASELAAAFGISEENVKRLGIGALGTLGAMKLMSSISGKELPDSAKNLQDAFKNVAGSMVEGNKPERSVLKEFAKASKAFTVDVASKTKEAVGLGPDEIAKAIDTNKLSDTYKQQTDRFKSIMEETEKYKGKGDIYAKYDELLKTQTAATVALLATEKTLTSPKMQDLTRTQTSERADLLKDLDVKEREKIVGEHPLGNIKAASPYEAAIKEMFSGDMADAGQLGKQIAQASGAGPSVLQQAVAAYIAATLSDFTFRRTDDNQRFTTLENRISNQADELGDLLLKYPEAAQKIIDDFKSDSKDLVKPTETTFVEESKLLDVKKEKDNIAKAMQEFGKSIAEEHEKVVKEQITARTIAAYRTFAEEIRMVVESSWKNIRTALDKSNIDRMLGQTARSTSALTGYSGDVTGMLDAKDMSVQQRVFATSSSAVKELITKYSEANVAMESMVTGLGDLVAKAREQQDIMNKATNPEIVDKARMAHQSLTEAINKQSKVIADFAKSMGAFALAAKNLNEFSAAMYKLNDAISDMAVTHLTENIKGYKSARDATDKLLGGPHPQARIIPTVAEERLGRKRGVTIQTKQDLEKAQLEERLYNTNDISSEEYSQILQQLGDIEHETNRGVYRRDEEHAVELLKGQMAPYQNALPDLERLKSRPGISGGDPTSIFGYVGNKMIGAVEKMTGISFTTASEITDAQKATHTALERATERITKPQAMKELNSSMFSLKNAWELAQPGGDAGIGLLDYFQARDRIKETPGEMVYRGMDTGGKLDIGSELRDIREDLEGNLQNLTPEMSQMEASVTEPIVTELKIIEALLAEETGTDADEIKGLLSSYTKDRGDVRDRTKESFLKQLAGKFATGGPINGPGGPTSDSILARVSNGEYVVNTDSARKIGYSNLDHINKYGKLPRFAYGGKVGGDSFNERIDYSEMFDKAISEMRSEGTPQKESEPTFANAAQFISESTAERRAKLNKEFEDMAVSAFVNKPSKVPQIGVDVDRVKATTLAGGDSGIENMLDNKFTRMVGNRAQWFAEAMSDAVVGSSASIASMVGHPIDTATAIAKIPGYLFSGEVGSALADYDLKEGFLSGDLLAKGLKFGTESLLMGGVGALASSPLRIAGSAAKTGLGIASSTAGGLFRGVMGKGVVSEVVNFLGKQRKFLGPESVSKALEIGKDFVLASGAKKYQTAKEGAEKFGTSVSKGATKFGDYIPGGNKARSKFIDDPLGIGSRPLFEEGMYSERTLSKRVKIAPTKLQETVDKIKTATGYTEAQQKILAAQKKGGFTDKIVGGIEAFGAVAKPAGSFMGELVGGTARHVVTGGWRKASEVARLMKFAVVDLPKLPKGKKLKGMSTYFSDRLKAQKDQESLKVQYGKVLAKKTEESFADKGFRKLDRFGEVNFRAQLGTRGLNLPAEVVDSIINNYPKNTKNIAKTLYKNRRGIQAQSFGNNKTLEIKKFFRNEFGLKDDFIDSLLNKRPMESANNSTFEAWASKLQERSRDVTSRYKTKTLAPANDYLDLIREKDGRVFTGTTFESMAEVENFVKHLTLNKMRGDPSSPLVGRGALGGVEEAWMTDPLLAQQTAARTRFKLQDPKTFVDKLLSEFPEEVLNDLIPAGNILTKAVNGKLSKRELSMFYFKEQSAVSKAMEHPKGIKGGLSQYRKDMISEYLKSIGVSQEKGFLGGKKFKGTYNKYKKAGTPTEKINKKSKEYIRRKIKEIYKTGGGNPQYELALKNLKEVADNPTTTKLLEHNVDQIFAGVLVKGTKGRGNKTEILAAARLGKRAGTDLYRVLGVAMKGGSEATTLTKKATLKFREFLSNSPDLPEVMDFYGSISPDAAHMGVSSLNKAVASRMRKYEELRKTDPASFIKEEQIVRSYKYTPNEERDMLIGGVKKDVSEKVSFVKDKIKKTFLGSKRADGGPISGPGGPTADAIPALLSDGEYVVNAKSTSKIGPHVMDHINKYGKIPRFYAGGDVDEDKLKDKTPYSERWGLETSKKLSEEQENFANLESTKRQQEANLAKVKLVEGMQSNKAIIDVAKEQDASKGMGSIEGSSMSVDELSFKETGGSKLFGERITQTNKPELMPDYYARNSESYGRVVEDTREGANKFTLISPVDYKPMRDRVQAKKDAEAKWVDVKFSEKLDTMAGDVAVPKHMTTIKLALDRTQEILDGMGDKLTPEQKQRLNTLATDSAYLLQNNFDPTDPEQGRIYKSVIQNYRSAALPTFDQMRFAKKGEHFNLSNEQGGTTGVGRLKEYDGVDTNLMNEFLDKSTSGELSDEQKQAYFSKFNALKQVAGDYRKTPEDYNRVRDAIIKENKYDSKAIKEYKELLKTSEEGNLERRQALMHMPKGTELHIPSTKATGDEQKTKEMVQTPEKSGGVWGWINKKLGIYNDAVAKVELEKTIATKSQGMAIESENEYQSATIGDKLSDLIDRKIKESNKEKNEEELSKLSISGGKISGGASGWLDELSNLTYAGGRGFGSSGRMSIEDILHSGALQGFSSGGPVTKTGPIFAHKGEFVVPQALAKGGMVEGDITTGTLRQAPQVANMDSLFKKIESMEFPELKIEKPPTIMVEMPTDKLTVGIDLAGADRLLSDAIKAALTTEVKVSVTGNGSGNAVGSEANDVLLNLMSKLHDQVININTKVDDKINILDVNKQTLDIDRRVVNLVSTLTSDLQKNITLNQQQIGDLSSTVRSTISRVDYQIGDIKSDLNRIRT